MLHAVCGHFLWSHAPRATGWRVLQNNPMTRVHAFSTRNLQRHVLPRPARNERGRDSPNQCAPCALKSGRNKPGSAVVSPASSDFGLPTGRQDAGAPRRTGPECRQERGRYVQTQGNLEVLAAHVGRDSPPHCWGAKLDSLFHPNLWRFALIFLNFFVDLEGCKA